MRSSVEITFMHSYLLYLKPDFRRQRRKRTNVFEIPTMSQVFYHAEFKNPSHVGGLRQRVGGAGGTGSGSVKLRCKFQLRHLLAL